MTTIRIGSALLAAATATVLLAGCGSDGSPAKSATGASAAGGSTAAPAAAAKGDGGGSGGDVNGPCDVTDRATVASVFPGASAGKPGTVRNCEYSFSSGPLSKVNIFYYAGTDLTQYKQGATSNGVKVTSVPVGDAAIRDQLHSVTVQQGKVLFGVQALPTKLSDLGKYDAQVLDLAKKIAGSL